MTCGFNFCTFNIHSSFTVFFQSGIYTIMFISYISYWALYIICNRVCTRMYTGQHIESCMYTYVHGTSYRIVYVHVCTRDIISNRVCTRMYTGHHIESCMYMYVHGTSYRIVYVHRLFLYISAYIDCITFNVCWVFKLILIHYFNFIYLMSVCSWKLLNLIKEQNT